MKKTDKKPNTKSVKGKELPPSVYTGLNEETLPETDDRVDEEDEELDRNWNRGGREDYEGWGDF